MREGKPMKKWSLLSIPLVGLASISVWAQAVAGAPADQFSGVVVREPSPRDSVLKSDGFTKRPGLAPIATPKATSPALKSAPLDPATSPATKATEAPDAGTAGTEDGVIVERVEPAQVTSPAVAPTDDPGSQGDLDESTSYSTLDDSTSATIPDDNGGLSGNKGTGGGSNE
jgi:hypothetical protein